MTDWAARARCRNPKKANPQDFDTDPMRSKPAMARRTERAKAVCAACPVKRACLLEGMHEAQGVWGGRTPAERELIRIYSVKRSAA